MNLKFYNLKWSIFKILFLSTIYFGCSLQNWRSFLWCEQHFLGLHWFGSALYWTALTWISILLDSTDLDQNFTVQCCCLFFHIYVKFKYLLNVQYSMSERVISEEKSHYDLVRCSVQRGFICLILKSCILFKILKNNYAYGMGM